MTNKKTKGQYGYRNYHKKMQLLWVALGALAIAVQLLARNFTDNQSAKNILTVMAVLSVLPMANLASPLLASWRFKTPPLGFYNRVSVHEGEYAVLYDLILTTKEFIMPMDAVVVHPLGVYAYCTSGKVDASKAEKSLNAMFTAQKLTPNVKVMKEEKSFFKRLESLKPASEYEDDGSVDYAVNFLKNMSM